LEESTAELDDIDRAFDSLIRMRMFHYLSLSISLSLSLTISLSLSRVDPLIFTGWDPMQNKRRSRQYIPTHTRLKSYQILSR